LKFTFITSVFDFFLPRFCPSCKNKLKPNEIAVCPACLQKIKITGEERLQYEFDRKFAVNKIISDYVSLYVFEKDKELQHIIHSLKYDRKFLTGKILGEKVGNHIKDKVKEWKIDFIIPVPLHPLKKAERGYNQSFYISKGLSKSLNIPVKNHFIKRKRFTQSQTTMNFDERQKNISNAFKVRNCVGLKGKNILLVDDVITTGSTISECGRVLLENRANKIFAASVAIAD
jgi:competence protein ComFC